MCRLVYIVDDRGPGPTAYKSGDVVAVHDDGFFLGTSVEPATATDGNLSVIELPGVSTARMEYLIALDDDPFIPIVTVLLKDGEAVDERNTTNIRRWHLDRGLFTAAEQAMWRLGRAMSTTEAVLESRVRDRQDNDRVVNRANLPRG